MPISYSRSLMIGKDDLLLENYLLQIRKEHDTHC